jgi:hypothetical protein
MVTCRIVVCYANRDIGSFVRKYCVNYIVDYPVHCDCNCTVFSKYGTNDELLILMKNRCHPKNIMCRDLMCLLLNKVSTF